jgi:hypothetical protein
MQPSPRDPENYSIDEIMDRLKKPPAADPDDGELVTRSDGSQAIRVRKRKRRTKQPRKEQVKRAHRVRIFRVSAALSLFFLALLAAGFAMIYANSSLFREGLLSKIAGASGASVQLQQFRMNPQAANASQLSLRWPDGNVLQSLSLGGITAEIFPSSFLGKVMIGEEVIANQGTLVLQIPKPGQARRSTPPYGESLPIQFNRYRIPSFQLILGNSSKPAIKLSKSECSLYPANLTSHPQLRLSQGDLLIAGWPKLRLDRGLMEFNGTETDIIGLRLLHEVDNRGSLELSGILTPYLPDQPSKLAVQLNSFELSGITGSSLGRLFSGQIDSRPTPDSNFLTLLPTEDPSPTLDIAFRRTSSSNLAIRGFPFLFALAQVLDASWFEQPAFEADAYGMIHRENDRISLRDLHCESKGRMALRGEISMTSDQTLSGNLQIGLAEAMIASSKNSRLDAMFGPLQEGFRWVTLQISGPAATPKDNFRDLFLAAVVAPKAEAPPVETKRSTFEELTRPK